MFSGLQCIAVSLSPWALQDSFVNNVTYRLITQDLIWHVWAFCSFVRSDSRYENFLLETSIAFCTSVSVRDLQFVKQAEEAFTKLIHGRIYQ